MKLRLNFNILNKLSLVLYFDHNFRKPSESTIPGPFFMATCVSFYNAAGNLDVYSMFRRVSFLDSSKIYKWFSLFQVLAFSKIHILNKACQQNSDKSSAVT